VIVGARWSVRPVFGARLRIDPSSLKADAFYR